VETYRALGNNIQFTFRRNHEDGRLHLITRGTRLAIWKGTKEVSSPYNKAWRSRGGVQEYLYSFFNLGARWGWVVNATPQPLNPREREPVAIVQRVGWTPGPVWTDEENLAPIGIRSPDHAARSESLYRLRYPYHTKQRNSPEERRSHQHRGRSLKSEENTVWVADSSSRNSEHLLEPADSLLCSQELATCPCPKPDQSSPRIAISFKWISDNSAKYFRVPWSYYTTRRWRHRS
jgi:hypothetical protein